MVRWAGGATPNNERQKYKLARCNEKQAGSDGETRGGVLYLQSGVWISSDDVQDKRTNCPLLHLYSLFMVSFQEERSRERERERER